MYGHMNNSELNKALRSNAKQIEKLQDTNSAIRQELHRRDEERQAKLFEVVK